MCAQVGGREAQTASEMFPLLYRPQDRVIAPEHALCGLEIPQFHCLPNRRAAHDRPVRGHRLNPDDGKVQLGAELFQEREITGAVFPKGPFLSDADFPQRPGRAGQLPNEISRRGRSQLAVKLQHQQVRDAEGPDERNLVLRCGEKTRAFLGTEKLCRVRVESNDDRCPARFLRVARRARNNRLMTAMDPVENANRKKNRPGNLRQLRD